jgi:hypothetical protein
MPSTYGRKRVAVVAHAVASDLFEAEDDSVPLDRCAELWARDGGGMDDVVVNLGDRGDVNVDRLAADDDADDVETLRKTRAGGNWLIGGMLDDVWFD